MPSRFSADKKRLSVEVVRRIGQVGRIMGTVKGWIETVYREYGPWAALVIGLAVVGVIVLIMRLVGIDFAQAAQMLSGLLQ